MASSPSQRVVVLAVDESEHSERAFDFYASHFHRPDIKLVAVNTPEMFINCESTQQKIESAIMELKARTEMIKNKFVEKMSKARMTGEFVSLEDKDPGHAVVRYAESVGATFIVTGSRGLSTVRRTLLGSVSDYILHHSTVPVLICRHNSRV